MVLCPVLGALSVKTWLSMPLLFLGSSAGIAALIKLGLEQELTAQVVLSAPLLFGFATVLALLGGSQVRWSSSRRKRWLKCGYPLVLLACALGADAIRLPVIFVLIIGSVAAILLGVVASRWEPAEPV